KLKQSYNIKLSSLKTKIIAIQLFLLLLFGYISYLLAKSALKPLQESIITLDKFAKDLIHDLNTPVTSIKLNMKILEREEHLKDNSAMLRMKKSVQTISELHENLTILLQEETFQMQNINICDVVEDVVQMHRQIYPDIRFEIEHSNLKLKLNPKATKQILQNIISNACKYNSKNGYVKIYDKDNALYIEDSGKGIKEPDKIFDRLYSAEQSSGMGLDIVKRLANAMDIEIEVKSDDNGTVFILRK
ncbi:MAG: HAMP domain-containing sensor histidine kinase, partial [Campylobacterota bacterium]|nr:HAMP domain-containing sensor histidine kinase [Campylobacterota bacterium]